MRILIVFFVLAVVGTGCAAGVRPYQAPAPLAALPDKSAFSASYDDVWQAALAAVLERGLTVELVQKESGVITTKSEYLWDGYGAGEVLKGIGYQPDCATCDWRTARYALVLTVSGRGATTTIQIKAKLEGFSGLWGWKEWRTAGVIEREILDAVQSKL